MGMRQSFQQLVLGKLDYPHAQNEVGPLSNIAYKNELEMDQKPKRKI